MSLKNNVPDRIANTTTTPSFWSARIFGQDLTFHDPSIYLCRDSRAAYRAYRFFNNNISMLPPQPLKEMIPDKSSRYNAKKKSWKLVLDLDTWLVAGYGSSVTNATFHDMTQS